MNGVEVANQLRANPTTAHIPIIFVTASSHNERKKSRNFDIGSVDFLFKPIDLDEACTKVFLFEKIIRLERRLKIIIQESILH
jgi:response regulator RpfG family c-di-GMP phosphodiesterase